MIFARLLRFLLRLPLRLLRLVGWLLRAPILLVRWLFRRLRRTRALAAGEAERVATTGVVVPTVGAIGKMHAQAGETLDAGKFVFFQTFQFRESDEPIVRSDDVHLAEMMAQRCRKYFQLAPSLFPPDTDFYEQVETEFVDTVTRLDSEEGSKDQFVDAR